MCESDNLGHGHPVAQIKPYNQRQGDCLVGYKSNPLLRVRQGVNNTMQGAPLRCRSQHGCALRAYPVALQFR